MRARTVTAAVPAATLPNWLPLGLLALLVVAPFVAPPYIRSLLIEVLIFAMLAMSLDLLLGHTGLASLGHAAFFGLGAYALAYAARIIGPNLLLTLPLTVVAVALLALLVGFFALRASGVAFLMITLAFSQLFYGLAIKWTDVTGGSDGISVERPVLGLGPLELSFGPAINFYFLVLLFFVAAWLGLTRLVGSPFGHTLRGIKANEARMRALGYNTQRFKLTIFVVAGVVAGIAGLLFAAFNRSTNPELLHWTLSGQLVVMTLIGGSGSLGGAVLGAALVRLLPSYVSSYTDRWSTLMGLVFIGFVLFAPQGLVGAWRQWRAKQ